MGMVKYAILVTVTPGPFVEREKDYSKIKDVLEAWGFTRQADDNWLFMGGDKETAVDAVMAIQNLGEIHPDASRRITSARLMRVTDDDDLTPAQVRDLITGEVV